MLIENEIFIQFKNIKKNKLYNYTGKTNYIYENHIRKMSLIFFMHFLETNCVFICALIINYITLKGRCRI